MDKISKIAIIKTNNSHESLDNFGALSQSDKVGAVRICNTIEDVVADKEIDIAVLADDFEILDDVLIQTDIKHILCDKNILSNIYQHAQIYPIIQKKETNLLIDYQKCYNTSIMKAKKIVKKNKLGKVLRFNALLDSGLFSNNFEFLVLIEHLFGDMINIKANDIEIIENDIFGYFWIETKETKGVLTNFKTDNFSTFELDIVCENGIIKIDEHLNVKAYKADKNKNLVIYKKYENTTYNAPMNSIKFLMNKHSFKGTEKQLKQSYKFFKIKNSFLEKKSMDRQ